MSGSMEDFFTSARRVKANGSAKKEEPMRTSQEKEKREVLKKEKVPTSTPLADDDHTSQKRYPERTFDRYIQKGARLRAEDVDLLKVFCSEITRAKRDLPYEYRSNKRITDNTVLRVLLQTFCEKIEDQLDTIDFKGIQTESELRTFIEETIKF